GVAAGPGASLPVLGALKDAVLTIRDAQPGIQFAAANYSVAETMPTATIAVVRSGPLTGIATVRFSTADGTAVGNVDYAPAAGVLTFGPMAATQSFTVRLMPDHTAGGPRSVLLLLSGANASGLGPRSSAVLTIVDTDRGGIVRLGTASM